MKEFHLLKPDRLIVKVSKINRNDNEVAHAIAQFGRREMCGGVLQVAVPTRVSNLALHDYNNDSGS